MLRLPKALEKYKSGMTVEMTCYQNGCEEVWIDVTLGDEYTIRPETSHPVL